MQKGSQPRAPTGNIPRHTPADAASLAEFDRWRPVLFSIAYRMTGSVADAEDLLQETYIRWQEASIGEVRSPRALLVTIVTRLSINHLHSARLRREQYVGQWLPEPIATDPAADPSEALQANESLSVAFLVLLERLNPVESAVFLLREVFDYEYSDITEILGSSEANCRQLLRRAQQHIDAARRRFTTSAEERSRLLEQFIAATRSGDMSGLLALFSGDVVLRSDGGGKAIAVPNLVQGADNVARAILGAMAYLVPKDIVVRVAQLNAAPAIVSYANGKLFSVISLGIGDGHILEVYVLTNPDKLAHFSELPAGAA